jgi:hypothetical protein
MTDVSKSRRNFPGVEKGVWYTLDELREANFGGTTETDSVTDSAYQGAKGYAKSYRKSGKKGRPWKSSSPRTNEN